MEMRLSASGSQTKTPKPHSSQGRFCAYYVHNLNVINKLSLINKDDGSPLDGHDAIRSLTPKEYRSTWVD